MTTKPVFVTIPDWIKENQKFFLPPVCNKMLHSEGQIKSFFVGGPNQRKDYHLEEGEELFYMFKGDMCLKVVEKGEHKDIIIKEGEIFLLPGYIMHSPQRQADTIGLVIERLRAKDETDGLRYFVEKNGTPTFDILYEKWFYCEDLGTQLAPIIKGFFASEQYKTGKPLPGTISNDPPVKVDIKRTLRAPFNLNQWIKENWDSIQKDGHKSLFGDSYQFSVDAYGCGENTDENENAEIWLWQLNGESCVTTGGETYNMKKDDSLLIPRGMSYSAKRGEGSVTLICFQDPTRKDVMAKSC
ncbi:3-hydroxyanthranilate 3,4-dioxygenase-like [Tubulanus polymorphus]|uniref:3-hydroxyanthranilate 3,4-dioxygenase-like n=1 Tax=Tubulanus polymorphus TaxID=672921 RepID=UPI003DA208D0